MTSSSADKIRDDDFSEEHRLPVDQFGAHETLRNQQSDIYDIIEEVIQNALDSKDKGLPNTIEIVVNNDAHPDEPILTVIDHGDGITKDYNNDLQSFLDARKATSEKRRRKGTIGNKGIGMFQYTHIGKNVIITSMNRNPTTGDPLLIYRIPLYLTDSGWTAFGKTVTMPATEQFMEDFGLHHVGTKVSFYNRDPECDAIDVKELRKVLRDQYTVIMADNPNVSVLINGKELELPKWIKDHPPKFIQRMSGCRDPELQEDYNITGAIWADSTKAGEIDVYVDGNLVQTVVFDTRQCQGYVNLNILKVISNRKAIIQDKVFNEFKEKMLREISVFPRITSDADKELSKSIPQMIKEALVDLLPKMPTAAGPENNKTKEITTGDPNGKEVTGYPITENPPDPNRVKEERKKGTEHDMRNQTKVGINGIHPVKRQSTEEDQRRKQYQDLKYIYRHADGKVLLKLFIHKESPQEPAELIIDKNSAEYVLLLKAKTRESKAYVIQSNLSEIIIGIDDETRAKLSKSRVQVLKSLRCYPKEAPIFQQRKGKVAT